jgi:NAD(P)-dependent dehydrogenase (short-subunit alcohol dehydrogenase family)
MDIRLDGRTAIITGGSKGLGLAMAAKFAASGAEVAILARGAEALAEAERSVAAQVRTKVRAYRCDVAKAAEIDATWRAIIAEFGKVDILINNAGTSQTGPFEEITDAVWQADLDLKLFAAIRLARLAMPKMKERNWGRIINVLNIGAKAPRPGSAPTAVSRAAGMALTKVLAGEGAPHNILVNAMLVGLFVTDQHVQRFRRQGGNVALEERFREMGTRIPVGRVGDAEEFANLACFLVSDAGSYVTGTAINVDGGMSPVV